MKIRLGVDIACRSPHHAACADEAGALLWSGHRFRTAVDDLESLWARLPVDAEEVMVVMEPTRNAWVPLAAWFRRHGAIVVMVPSEQSSDLRDYFSKHTKTDRLDAELLARLPLLHPDGLHHADTLGPGDPLKRAVKIRAGLVHRRSTAMHRLDSLLEILGPGWTDALGTRMTSTTFKFLAAYANPHQVKRLGRARLARWFQHHSRKAWGPERADAIIAAAETTIGLWGNDGLDFDALAADIAAEATIALEVSEQIALLDRRIRDLYTEADPDGIVLSVPGVGDVLAGQILGRLGDPHRFTSLAAARSFSGLIPRQNSSGLTNQAGGPTKRGDACLRAALFQAADRARHTDPQLAARYQRLMCDTGRHHNSATCTIATVLLTRIVSCLRNHTPYELRDVDGTAITIDEGRTIIAKRYQIPSDIRSARRTIAKIDSANARTSGSRKESQNAPRHRSSRHQHEPSPRPLTTIRNSTARCSPAASGQALGRCCSTGFVGRTGSNTFLTRPRSPTTTGKVERWHKTLRREFLDGKVFASIEDAQAQLDVWVEHYNHERPHQSLGMMTPWDRFKLARNEPAAPQPVEPCADPAAAMPPSATRRVDRKGTISFAAAHYKVGVWLAGQDVNVVCDGGLVQIHHRGVLIATHARHHELTKQQAGMQRQTRPREAQPRPTTSVVTVTRKVDSSGNVSFAGASYRVGNAYRRRQVQVAVVGEHVEIAIGEQLIRRHNVKHDRTREHGALANPGGRPRRINAA